MEVAMRVYYENSIYGKQLLWYEFDELYTKIINKHEFSRLKKSSIDKKIRIDSDDRKYLLIKECDFLSLFD